MRIFYILIGYVIFSYIFNLLIIMLAFHRFGKENHKLEKAELIAFSFFLWLAPLTILGFAFTFIRDYFKNMKSEGVK